MRHLTTILFDTVVSMVALPGLKLLYVKTPVRMGSSRKVLLVEFDVDVWQHIVGAFVEMAKRRGMHWVESWRSKIAGAVLIVL